MVSFTCDKCQDVVKKKQVRDLTRFDCGFLLTKRKELE